MRNTRSRSQGTALARDLGALRRYFWFPLATLAVAVVVALTINAVRPGDSEARFRENVVVDALPPLFGPAVLPSPFDYARLASSDGVLTEVAGNSGVPVDQLRGRLNVEVRPNRPEVDFRVTGSASLRLARIWREAFAGAAARQTPDIERLLVQSYARQLDEARAVLEQRASDAARSPDDAVARQQLAAAQENFETASKLSQSYDVVAKTMRASSLPVVAPHTQSAGVGSMAGRLGASVAIGLLVGVGGVIALDVASRRRDRNRAPEPVEAPTAFRRTRGGT